MKSLNVVGHPDDDLLFLNPDILEEMERQDSPYQIYITAGDDGRDEGYVNVKRSALRNVYGGTTAWRKFMWVKSNSHRSGDSYGSLYRMFNDRNKTEEGFVGHELSYDYIIGALIGLIETIKPDVIRTHDPDCEPSIDHDEPHLDHIDHIYTAKFVQEAAKAFPHIPVYAYMSYPIRYQPENVSPELAAKKLQMWRRYQEIDTEVAGEQWDLAMTRQYKRRIQ